MTDIGIFPFGCPIEKVTQIDRSPKKVFVLGVYASAVHAKWIGPDNKVAIQALGVRSEPYIFWKGENAESLISDIPVPTGMGKLVPANGNLNGPSGIALDAQILHPLKLQREDAWLCDLVPHSCMNPGQEAAILREYIDLAKAFGAPLPKWPKVPKILADDNRRAEILKELNDSKAQILILLGDLPIKWFLNAFHDNWKKLDNFGSEKSSYGRLHEVAIDGVKHYVLPLAHPRQVAKLGKSSSKWFDLHRRWKKEETQNLLF